MELPVAPFKYPLSDQLFLANKYSGLDPINWVMDFNSVPTAEQESLFGLSLEEEIIDELPKIWKTCKSPAAQLKRLAKKMKIDDLKFLEKAMDRAKGMMRQRALFENYQAHKDYFKWLHTPDYYRHRDSYLAAINRRYKESEAQGDHIIEIGGIYNSRHDEFESRMNPFNDSRLYMSDFAAMITRKDFITLQERGMLTLTEGNPDTLDQYAFKPEEAARESLQPVKEPCCGVCGEPLNTEIVGVNIKLGAQEPEQYKCYSHLGITEQEAKSLIAYYRSTGCPLFE